jgi:hypothetical protein
MGDRSTTTFSRPAVFFVNAFGDQLMALPAMRALATMFPHGIQLLLGEGMLSFFYRELPVTEPVRVWWADSDEQIIDVGRIARCTAPCDLFLCLSTWTRPSVLELAGRMGASLTIGHSETFDEFVPVDESAHMFDFFFSIPQRLRPDLRFDDFSFAPNFSPAAENAAERFVRERVKSGKRILFVHPETLPHKMWSPLSFSWVLERFLDARSDFTVFVASVSRYPLELERNSHRVVCIEEHLELAMAILKYADLFLGVDSCFLHAADLFRVPGLGLFAHTDPQQWGFRLSPHARSIRAGSMLTIPYRQVLDVLLEIAEGVLPYQESSTCESQR